MYRFVSSNESVSMSLHESIIEEEEIDDAEVCDSIVYVVDGESSYMKEYQHDLESNDLQSDEDYIDNNSGSGSSSDVTIIDANNIDSSSVHQVCDVTQLPIHTNLPKASEINLLERQIDVDKYIMKDNSQVVQVKQTSSSSSVNDTVRKNNQTSDIKKIESEHKADESFSKHGSTPCSGNILINYAYSRKLIVIYNVKLLHTPTILKFWNQ